MKKIQFYLQKRGVSAANGGIISSPKDFIYEFDEEITVKDLVDLCRKIYKDIKNMMAEKNATEVTAYFGHLVINECTHMCDFITGWLNENGDKRRINACVLVERMIPA